MAELMTDEQWRDVLNGVDPDLKSMRRFFKRLPSDPRCKLCFAPSGAPFGPIMTLAGYGPYKRNPQLCNACFRSAEKHPGGAEIELSMLFADVRGSSAIAERMAPAGYSKLLARFYRQVTEAVQEPGGLVDKFLGDGVMALFVPGFTGPDHAAKAVAAARHILADAELPVGAGVHTGTAYVGFLSGGTQDVVDFSALGDAVNIARRLGEMAAAGELVISHATAYAAHLETSGLQARRLDLKGKSEQVDAWAETVKAPQAAEASVV